MRYTLGQVAGYMAAIERQAKGRRIADALDARMAAADGKVWKKYVADMRKGGP